MPQPRDNKRVTKALYMSSRQNEHHIRTAHAQQVMIHA
jgi:hypothetical protein